MKKCSACGYENSDRETTCASCHKPLSSGETVYCPSCGKQLKAGLRFCTGCGFKLADSVSTPANAAPPVPARPAPSGTGGVIATKGGFGKSTLFAILSGALSLLTVIFVFVFMFTPFLKIEVSMFGMSDSESVSGISVFASLISGNDTLTALGVSSSLGYVASVAYWIFAFVFTGYLVFAISSVGSANRLRFLKGIKLLSVMTVLSFIIMILGNVAASQATKDAEEYVKLGAEIKQYVSGTGLFVTMLLMLAGYITLFVLYKNGKDVYPLAGFRKAHKPVKILLFLVVSVLAAVSIIVGIVGAVGSGSKDLVKKYVEAINKGDYTTVAECMYPKGSTEYTAMVAMGSLGLPYGGNISDWKYNKIEKNDYVERGNMHMVVSGSVIDGVFYMQKSSADNKWHITENYKATYYDGNIGTSYANACKVSSGSAGEARYLMYECEESGRYKITSEKSFSVKRFDTGNIAGSTQHYSSGTYSYSATCEFTAGKAYYIVLDSAAACSIGKDEGISSSDVSGTLSNSSSYTVWQSEKIYSIDYNLSGICLIYAMDSDRKALSDVAFTLYDSNYTAVEGTRNKSVIVADMRSGTNYYLGFKLADGVESSVSAYIRIIETSDAGNISDGIANGFSIDTSVAKAYSFTPSASTTYSVAVSTSNSSDNKVTVLVFDDEANVIAASSQTSSSSSPYKTVAKFALTADTAYTVAVISHSYNANYSVIIQDPNAASTRETAKTIVPGIPENVSIGSAGETKWYKFTPTRSYECDIYTTGYCDTYGVIYRYSGYGSLDKVASNDDGGNNENFKCTVTLSSSYTYYIAVRLNGEETGSFTLNVSRFENGSSYETAYTVPIGSSNSTAVTYNGGEPTYYRFVAGSTTSYNVYTSGSSTVKVTVLDDEGNVLASKTSVSPANADLYVDCESGKEYFITVQIVGGSSSSTSTLKVA